MSKYPESSCNSCENVKVFSRDFKHVNNNNNNNHLDTFGVEFLIDHLDNVIKFLRAVMLTQ